MDINKMVSGLNFSFPYDVETPPNHGMLICCLGGSKIFCVRWNFIIEGGFKSRAGYNDAKVKKKLNYLFLSCGFPGTRPPSLDVGIQCREE